MKSREGWACVERNGVQSVVKGWQQSVGKGFELTCLSDKNLQFQPLFIPQSERLKIRGLTFH